ncbi:hypothetical protein AMTRI_Chr10g6010 [Amborella trichopoda]
MGFISFAGRVLLPSIFIIAAWQRFNEFGDDGGAAVKLLEPKYALLKSHATSSLGFRVPEIEIKHLVAAEIGLKGIVDRCSGGSFSTPSFHIMGPIFPSELPKKEIVMKVATGVRMLLGLAISIHWVKILSKPWWSL